MKAMDLNELAWLYTIGNETRGEGYVISKKARFGKWKGGFWHLLLLILAIVHCHVWRYQRDQLLADGLAGLGNLGHSRSFFTTRSS